MPITLGTYLLHFQHFQNLYSRGLKIWKYPWHRHNAGHPSLSQWEPLPTYHPMISPYNTQTDTACVGQNTDTQTDTGAKYRHTGRQRGKIQTQVQNTDTKTDGKNILHLQPYHLFGFCLDCYIESQNSLDRSKLRPSQTPTIHPSEFFGHITFSVPNIKL